MILAKDLKQIINQIPDNIPVSLGDCYDCDIIGASYSSLDRIVKLKLTDGFTIITKEFLDGLFDSFRKKSL